MRRSFRWRSRTERGQALQDLYQLQASPTSAEPGAAVDVRPILRPTSPSSWSAEQVMPGPNSSGGLAGRAWEQVVERHVLHLDAKVEEAEERADTSGSSRRH